GWWIVNGPNGGYVAAVLLRAVLAEAGDGGRRPRTLHVQYLRPPAEGDVDVGVTVERAGRTVTNLTVRMFQEGRLLALGLASLAVDRDAPVAYDEDPGLPTLPDGRPVPRPEEVPHVEVDPERDVPMRGHYDLRWVLGDLPFRPGPTGEARARCGGWLRPAEPEPVDEVVLTAMSDAWMPPIFCRVDHPLAVPTIDLTVHYRGLPRTRRTTASSSSPPRWPATGTSSSTAGSSPGTARCSSSPASSRWWRERRSGRHHRGLS